MRVGEQILPRSECRLSWEAREVFYQCINALPGSEIGKNLLASFSFSNEFGMRLHVVKDIAMDECDLSMGHIEDC